MQKLQRLVILRVAVACRAISFPTILSHLSSVTLLDEPKQAQLTPSSHSASSRQHPSKHLRTRILRQTVEMDAFITTPALRFISAPKRLSTNLSQRRLSPTNPSCIRNAAAKRPTASTLPITDSPQKVSCLGRGKVPPRRVTGLYELEREGVDLSNLISETRTEETVLGGAVALFGAATLLLPLLTGSSFEGPLAAIAAVALTTWAVDALALNGLLSRAGSLALQDGARVAYHEAGHMIIGHMLGFEVTGYTHPTARALLRGEEVGVRFENGTTSDAYSVGALGMAGVAGEVVRYGSSQGGQEDLAEVSRAVRSVGGDVKLASRWGMLAGVQILKAHPKAHEEVAAAMRAGDGVAKCLQVLETFAEGGELTPA